MWLVQEVPGSVNETGARCPWNRHSPYHCKGLSFAAPSSRTAPLPLVVSQAGWMKGGVYGNCDWPPNVVGGCVASINRAAPLRPVPREFRDVSNGELSPNFFFRSFSLPTQ